ncbi:MAG: hypothetical protein RL711_501 [Bacteroidota bacterium]
MKKIILFLISSLFLCQGYAQSSIDLLVEEPSHATPYTLSGISTGGYAVPVLTASADKVAGTNALKLTAASGLGNGVSGVKLKFNALENLDDFWKIRFQVKSLSNLPNVKLALEIVLASAGGTTTSWIQKPAYHVPLSEVYNAYHEIAKPIHVLDFQRYTNNDGSFFELKEVVGVNLLLITTGNVNQNVEVLFDGLEFFDKSPYAGLVSNVPPTIVPDLNPTLMSEFMTGGNERLGIYISDPKASWLSLVVALKNIGIPVKIYTDLTQALQHSMLMVYPEVSTKVLTSAQISSLSTYVQNGGKLMGFHVKDALLDVFGLASTQNLANNTTIRDIRFTTKKYPEITQDFDHKFEERVRIYRWVSNMEGYLFASLGADGYDPMSPSDTKDGEIYGYVASTSDVIAIYDNDITGDENGTEKAAITRNVKGAGAAYAMGWDIGFMGTINYAQEYATSGNFYSDGYSPGFDVALLTIKKIYQKENPMAVTLWPVPNGKDLSIVMSHDIDANEASTYSPIYANMEQSNGVKATYFWQTRYMTDAVDMRFFNSEAITAIHQILALPIGHEIGSHSQTHAVTYTKFPMGDGNEQFPSYQPRSYESNSGYNVIGGTILGELRVSKFLLDHFIGVPTKSWRPGNLSYPVRMNEATLASGYQYMSTTTAPYSATHLPHLSYYYRSIGGVLKGRNEQVMDFIEIPLSWDDIVKNSIKNASDDANLSKLGMAEPQYIAETQEFLRQLGQYGGNFTLLIHPTQLGHRGKFAYEEAVINSFKAGGALSYLKPHYDNIKGLGAWWLARHKTEVDVSRSGQVATVTLHTQNEIDGLSLKIPTSWILTTPSSNYTMVNGFLVIGKLLQNATVNIAFTIGGTPPTVSLTAPVNNASYTAPATVNITANAADTDGTVSKVDFFAGTTLIGTDNTSPYGFVWNNVAAGNYALTAKVTDNANLVTSSAVIQIVVNGTTNSAPVISSSALTNATSGMLYAYTIVATDANAGDVLTYSAPIIPTWLSFNTSTRVLAGTPSAMHVGTHNVTLRVSDGKVATDQVFVITVTGTSNTKLVDDFEAGDGLTGSKNDLGFSIESWKANLAVNAGVLNITNFTGSTEAAWTSNCGGLDYSSYLGIEIKAKASVNATAIVRLGKYNQTTLNLTSNYQSFWLPWSAFSVDGKAINFISVGEFNPASTTINIDNVSFGKTGAVLNNAPVITSTAITTGKQDVAYSYTLTATDADAGDVLSYSAPSIPAWLSFNTTTHVLSGTPLAAHVGAHNVTLRVSDGKVNTDQNFVITVASISAGNVKLVDDFEGGDGLTGTKNDLGFTIESWKANLSVSAGVLNLANLTGGTEAAWTSNCGGLDYSSYLGIEIKAKASVNTTAILRVGKYNATSLNLSTSYQSFWIPWSSLSVDGKAIAFISIGEFSPTTATIMIDYVNFGKSNSSRIGEIELDVRASSVLYPNPTTGFLYIDHLLTNVQLYSMEGKLLSVFYNDAEGIIDLNVLHKGVYLISYEKDGIPYVSKIMKQ